ncbi:MAG: SAM-dependent methyltransferase [Kofleriaceae bacterium]
MDAGSAASKTALMVCAYRARASAKAHPLFVDPWAKLIAGDDGEAIARGLDQRWPPMELWLTLRVAYLDRLVGLAVDELSIRQIVILGAGYDTRAARLPRAGVRFFEVDHPATQAAKKAVVGKLPGYPLEAATYVACDFEREDPIERLVANGFLLTEPALIVWEGVVMYLTEEAIRATAKRLATLHPHSVVAFDFFGKRLAMAQGISAEDQHTRSFVGELGEPIRFGSDHILPLLYESGFRWARQINFDEIALEFLGDYVRDRAFRFQHIALASGRTPVAGWP